MVLIARVYGLDIIEIYLLHLETGPAKSDGPDHLLWAWAKDLSH